MPAAPRVALISKMATQLVPLQDVERLSSSVIRVLGGNPGKVSHCVRKPSLCTARCHYDVFTPL